MQITDSYMVPIDVYMIWQQSLKLFTIKKNIRTYGSNISYMNINRDSILRENTILSVIYCLLKYHLNWRLSPGLLEKKNKQDFDKLIEKCTRMNFKYKEI